MDRQVPSVESEEIELYVRTYYSLLRSTGEILVRSLEETHAGMNSSLHPGADEPELDVSAFVYSSLRLPPCIIRVRLIVLGQSEEVFERRGRYTDVRDWQPVHAPARRRKMFFNGKDTLAAFIASVSDIDMSMVAGTGMTYGGERIGPLAIADKIGLDAVVETLTAFVLGFDVDAARARRAGSMAA